MIITYFVCLVILNSYVKGYTMTDAKRLLADKMEGYEKTFRPLVNQSLPVVVSIAMELASIQEFDEVQGKLTITAVIRLEWTDEYMIWNSSEYGGLELFIIESDKVWTPCLVLTNNVENLKKIGDSWQAIRFTPDGRGHFFPGSVLSASCKVDVTYYPWDKHICEFSFTVWSYIQRELAFEATYDKVQTSFFSENSVWTFYNSSVKVGPPLSDFYSYLYLKRKPVFVVVTIVIPIVCMAYIDIMTFYIPIESGERVSYSITVLLAIGVFLTLVADNLPKVSHPMSFFSYYLLVVLVNSICVTFSSIFNVRLYYRDDDVRVPKRFLTLVKYTKTKCKKAGMTVHLNAKVEGSLQTDANVEKHLENPAKQKATFSRYNKDHVIINQVDIISNECSKTFEDASEIKSNKKQQVYVDTDPDVSWRDVSVACDKLCFALSFSLMTIVTVVYFLLIVVSEVQ